MISFITKTWVMKTTVSVTKKNEKKVRDLLEENFPGKWTLHPNEFSHYDIYGESDGVRALVEVKKRKQMHPYMWIEKYKADRILDIKKRNNIELALYVCSVGRNHYLYDIEELVHYELITKEMKKYTSEEFLEGGYEIIEKEVYNYWSNDFMINLHTKYISDKFKAFLNAN